MFPPRYHEKQRVSPECLFSAYIDSFVSGNYGTGFIKEHYPHGFTGVKLTPRETAELIAGAACLHHTT